MPPGVVTELQIACVRPELPPPESYLPFLEQAHAARRFTNFGPLALGLERELERGFGLPGEVCISAASATAGLSAALLTVDRPGPVLVPAFTFPASLGAIRAAGREAVIADVDAQTWALPAATLKPLLQDTGAAAAMLVAPFGLAVDLREHLDICRRLGVAAVIDNAAGLGARRFRTEARDDVFEVYSLHATKPFAIGEGGAILAHESRAEALRSAINFALATGERPGLPAWGFNGKLSEFHAAVGLAQASGFADRVRARRAFAAGYVDAFEAKVSGVSIAAGAARDCPWQVFPVLAPSAAIREAWIAAAREQGMEVRRYYSPSLSRWPGTCLAELCPVAESLAERMAALPVRGTEPEATPESIRAVAVTSLLKALA